jgi:outer membrane protein OmpA-like peptidoglycan-associated protein
VTTYRTNGTVRVYSVRGTVRTYTADRSVTPLETTRTSGRDTTVSLGSDVLFDFGKDSLSPSAAPRLTALARAVAAAGGTASVTGYTDSVGDPASNLALSRRRAQAVAEALSAAAPGLRLTVTGRGEADPVAPNTTGGQDDPVGRAQNRRVTTTYTTTG